MLRNMKIPHKFPLLMIGLALLSAILMGAISYKHATSAMEREAGAKMVSLLESRAATLNQYFHNIENDLQFHAQSAFIAEALSSFTDSWEELGDGQSAYLQGHYIDRNPFSYGQRYSLLAAEDGSAYSEIHRKFHSPLVSLIRTGGYHDAFLISPEGDIVYTVVKERDFATNAVENPNTAPLRELLENLTSRENLGDQPEAAIYFTDFESYGPSERQVAGFFGTRVYDENANFLGVLALQISIDAINNIMQVTAGMGETGETYLVGPDNLMRSDSRFLGSSSILTTRVESPSVAQALSGFSGVQTVNDYRGESVLSAYAPLDIMRTPWVILAEMDQVEVLAPVKELTLFLSISGVAVAVAIAVLGYLLASDLSRPIVTMTNVMNRLAKNDLKVNVSVDKRTDEIGQMARALTEFKEFAVDRDRLQQELNHRAQHDGLTGLPNREFAFGYLEDVIRQNAPEGQSFAVMLADVDGFKQVNDALGHGVGDQVLMEISNRFRYLMQGRNIACRLGGDEFLFILPECQTLEECERIAAKILETSKASFALSDRKQEIQLSLGVARFPTDGTAAFDLAKAADKAMYQAKRAGKNQFLWASR